MKGDFFKLAELSADDLAELKMSRNKFILALIFVLPALALLVAACGGGGGGGGRRDHP